jgi:hypothetical protein
MYYAQMVDYIAKGQVEEAPLEGSKTVLPAASGGEERESWED